MKITKEMLSKCPFLNPAAIQPDRVVWLPAVYSQGKWDLFIATEDDLIPMSPVDCASGIYIGDEKADPADIEDKLVSLVFQRLNFSENIPLLRAIIDDLSNFRTVLTKLRHYQSCAELLEKEKSGLVWGFVSTDLEYLFFLARSYYDLVHRLSFNISKRLVNLKSQKKIVTATIPNSFRKVLMVDNAKIRTPEEITEKWQIPLFITKAYCTQGEFFPKLRHFRDSIGHREGEVGTIFAGDELLISIDEHPFKSFADIWKPHEINANRLASLDTFVGHIIDSSMLFADEIELALRSVIQVFPEPTFFDKKVFLRTNYVRKVDPKSN
ncbi:MAG: hypothetical protein ACXVCG_01535 [Bdellovibrionota bacterium]